MRRVVLALAITLSMPVHAQEFCNPAERYFQEQPTPASPRERVNGINLSSCSSGMPCLNQLRAAMAQVQPAPSAHRWVKREAPQAPCLQSVPLSGSGAPTTTAPAPAAAQ